MWILDHSQNDMDRKTQLVGRSVQLFDAFDSSKDADDRVLKIEVNTISTSQLVLLCVYLLDRLSTCQTPTVSDNIALTHLSVLLSFEA